MNTQSSGDRDPGGLFASVDSSVVWRQGAAQRAQFLGPATELMLDLADLREGSRVLDVAAGTGEQSLMAVGRIGASGHVLAIDLAAHMLEEAAASARAAGIETLETRVMDAQHLDLESESFDAVLSRLGVMFVPDPGAAFEGIWRVLKPGGKFAALVHGAVERNQWASVSLSIIRRVGRLPQPERSAPGMFALGDPGRLAGCFKAAGFKEVAERTVDATRRYPSLAAALQNITEAQLASRTLLSQLSAADRATAVREIELALEAFVGPDGVALPGEVVVGVGTK